MFRFSQTTSTLRLAAVLGASTIMAGCSWLPFGGGSHAGYGQGAAYGAHHAGSYGAGKYGPAAYGQPGHCTIPHAQAPIPQGCDPALVTVGLGQFAQQPQFGQPVYGSPQYASSGYGSHAGSAHAVASGLRPASAPGLRSRFRGFGSIGVEKSVSGSLLDYADSPADPTVLYDPDLYAEGTVTGSPQEGAVVRSRYTSETEEILAPTVSWDDVYSTPLSLKGGFEYALTPRTSAYASAGYTVSEGARGAGFQINSTLFNDVTTTNYEATPIIDPVTGFVTGTNYVAQTPINQRYFVPNVENTAAFTFDFSDLRRTDLEAGVRHYFKPLAKHDLKRVSPFVAASAGASRFNDQTYTVSQQQAFLQRSFDAQTTEDNLYNVVPPVTGDAPVTLYESQWVPRGAINAGVEWQATDRTAIAFETGVQVEGGRKYVTGERADTNVSIPLTVRGSFNF